MKQALVIALLLIFAIPARALEWQDSQAVEKLFRNADVEGTFVLYDPPADRFIGHNRARAETRFIPASTFKIPNSLIGLWTGAVADVDEVLPYGGEPQPFEQWEQDMGLRDAIRISNVPVYQELARRIGLDRMRDAVTRLDYGNGEIGTIVDRFWLDGPLKISAIEQTRFLARLGQNALPLPEDIQAQVRQILQMESGQGWALYGKTGWAWPQTPDDPGTGWWVGWIHQDDRLYTFALNINMSHIEQGPLRLELGRASLRALDLLRETQPSQ